ncbi:MAG: WD40/YVTN/BNR-like repeat-containing protein [Roseburia sp.]
MKRENTRKKYQLKNWLKAGMILLLVCLGGLYFFKTSERFQKNDEVKVTLKHDNFFDDSVAGILEDLDNEIGLPKKIYLVNHFNVTFYATGEIAAIDTFFYGEDENGETRTYLVDYNRKKSSKMTVYINNYAETDYEEDMCLTPLFELLGNIKVKEQVDSWAEETKSHTFGISYSGKRAFTSADSLQVINAENTDTNGNSILSKVEYGGEVTGFAVTFSTGGEENTGEIITYIINPKYISAAVLAQQNRREQIDEAKNGAGNDTTDNTGNADPNAVAGDDEEESGDGTPWTENREDGSVYFFLDDNTGYRLLVADAAAGSRFYELEMTKDGGQSWNQQNADPFDGNIGVAEGIEFYNENLGVIGLAGASGDYSTLYLTQDGGKTFSMIELSMDEVTELPDTAAEYGFSISDYDYCKMPQQKDGKLIIKVISAMGENDGILFESIDSGNTWNYSGISY